jgi:glycosyltransferase involved in cell wall biosynthesis
MKNILVNFLGRKGGTALYAYEMTKGLIENGAEVYAIVSKQNEMIDEWKKLKLKKLVIIPTYTNKYNFIVNSIKFYLFSRLKIKSYFINEKIDCIYIPCFHPWFSSINKLFNKINTKIVITIHDPIPHTGSFFKNKLICLVQRKDLLKADEIIILSNRFKKYVENTYKKKSSQIHVIPHGIFNYYKNIEMNFQEDLYNKNKINFLFFGRIEPYKGLNILGQAYREIRDKYTNVSLTVVGNGDFSPYKNDFANLMDFKLINRWIKDEEVNMFFKGENIVTVLPYLDATQSGVINIAMMNKSLVIATNTGGISEQIENRKTGLLISPNDKQELVNAMEYVINNNQKCKEYIQNASIFLLGLDWRILSKTLFNIIDKEVIL